MMSNDSRTHPHGSRCLSLPNLQPPYFQHAAPPTNIHRHIRKSAVAADPLARPTLAQLHSPSYTAGRPTHTYFYPIQSCLLLACNRKFTSTVRMICLVQCDAKSRLNLHNPQIGATSETFSLRAFVCLMNARFLTLGARKCSDLSIMNLMVILSLFVVMLSLWSLGMRRIILLIFQNNASPSRPREQTNIFATICRKPSQWYV